MTIWVDAQLSLRTARWIAANFPVAAAPLRDLGLRDASDEEIFAAARTANAIVFTKDSASCIYWSSMAAHPKSFGSPAATLPRWRCGRFFRSISRLRSVYSPVART